MAKKKRKRRKSKRRDLQTLLMGFAGLVILICAIVLMAPGNKNYDDFLDALGMRESTNNYALVNSYGFSKL